MCGIFGVISNEHPVDVLRLKKASSALKHRGPDQYGFFLEQDSSGGRVFYDRDLIPSGLYYRALAHRRLSIIDLDMGRQPMTNEDGSIWCVLNGEIYNYRSLRKTLTDRGHSFKTNSDTEVLCHGYEEWENEIVKHIEGIFAFCIYDSNKKTATLFRDPIGVKPLYYYLDNNLFLFASEIQAILAYDPTIRIADENIFNFFLFDQIPGLKTPFQGILKLDAGEFCVLDCVTMRILEKNKYWDFRFHVQQASEKETIAKVQRTLERVVEKQWVADVPVGVFLSGGIDSSLVAHFLMKKASSKAFHLYSEDGFSEYRWVQKIKGLTDENLIKVLFDPELEDCLNALKNVSDLLYDSSLLPTYYVSKEARKRGFKVIMSGDGGDENFAGYDTNFYPAFLFLKYQRMKINLWGRSFLFKLVHPRYFDMLNEYIRQGEVFSLSQNIRMNNLLSARKFSGKDVVDFRMELLAQFQCEGDELWELNRVLYVWYRTFLQNILRKVDTASMTNGVEVRVPLLDIEMVNLALSIPFRYKIKSKGKYPLKIIAEKLWGREFAYRPKRGFTFDFSKIFLKPGIDSYLRDNLRIEGLRKFLDITSILQLIDQNKRDVQQGKKLWRVLMFVEWYKNWGIKHA